MLEADVRPAPRVVHGAGGRRTGDRLRRGARRPYDTDPGHHATAAEAHRRDRSSVALKNAPFPGRYVPDAQCVVATGRHEPPGIRAEIDTGHDVGVPS